MLKNLRSTFINFALAAILVAGVALPAQAAFIDLTGSVNFAESSNIWGITTGSLVSGTATWNENLLTNTGLEVLTYYDDPLMNLVVSIGGFSYEFLADTFFKNLDFGFSNDFLKNIALLGNGPDSSTFDIAFDFPGDANIFFINSGEVTGEIAPVPEPSTFLLLGAGLGGLIYVQRRRKNG